MAYARTSYNAAIVGLFGFLLYLIITINNHKDEVHSKDLLTKANSVIDSSHSAAFAMLNEVKMLGFCYDDCKLLFGRLHNRKGEWNIAIEHCSELTSKKPSRESLLCLASSHIGLGNSTLSLDYLTKSLQVQRTSARADEAAIMQLSNFYLDMHGTVTSTLSHDIVAFHANYSGLAHEEARNRLSCGYVSHLLDSNQTLRANLFTKKVITSAYDAGFDEHIVHSHFSVWLKHQSPQEAVQVANFVHFMLPKKSPRKVFSMKLYGEALLAMNTSEHTTRAIEVLLEARHLSNSSDANVFLLLSRAYEVHEDLPQSAGSLESAVQLLGEVVPFPLLIRLSRLQLAIGQYTEMLDTLQRALTWCDGSDVILSVTQEECSEAHLLQGKARHRLGMTSAAIKSYYKACVGHSPFEKEALADLMDIANSIPPNPAPLTAWKKKTHGDEHPEHHHQHYQHHPEVVGVESAAASVASAAVEEVQAAHGVVDTIVSHDAVEPSPVAPAAAVVEELPKATTELVKPEVDVAPVPKTQPVSATSAASTTSAEDVVAKARASALQYLQTARAFYDKGWLDKALVEIGKALRKVPDLVEAMGLRGEIHADLGKYDEAVSDLSKLYQHHREQNPKSAESGKAFNGLLDLALKMDELKFYDHSAAIFKIIHTNELMPVNDPTLWLSVSRAFAHIGDYQLAIAALDTIPSPAGSALTEERKKILQLKSDYFNRLGQKDKADAVWAEVMQASESLREKGNVQYASGQLSDAVKSYEAELKRLQDLVSNENNHPRVRERLSQEAGEVHQKLGRIYSDLAKKAADEVAASEKTQVSSTSATTAAKGELKNNQLKEKLYASKAHTHYLEAMEKGQYDLDMRRFFSTHPLPENMRMTAVDKEGATAAVGTRKHRKHQTSEKSKEGSAEDVDGESESSVNTTEVEVEPLPSMRTRHRWVVRHLVDQQAVEEEDADTASEGAPSSEGVGSAKNGLGGSRTSRMSKSRSPLGAAGVREEEVKR